MIQLYAADDHFSFITNQIEADEHAHTMIQITLSFAEDLDLVIENNTLQCKGIMIASKTPHVLRGREQTLLFFLIDPTSTLGESLKKHYLQESAYRLIGDELTNEIVTKLKEWELPLRNLKEYTAFFNFFLQTFNIEGFQQNEVNQTVKQVIDIINSASGEIPSIEQLAQEVYLSQSRLSHLFKENTGFALYSYLLMQKIRRTIALVFQGSSITAAAMAGGFDSPSHFASVCKRTFGMSPRSFSKDSVYLKVSNYP